jgi:membrane protein implicated in regulation of membrane protease activity
VRVSTYDKIAWLPLCGGLTGLGLVLSYLAMRRRGVGVGLRWAAWSLLPIAAYLTGSIEMFWKMGVAIGDFAKGFAFSPRVWSGIALAGLAVVLFVVSGPLRRRSVGRGQDRQAAESGAGSTRALSQDPATAGRGQLATRPAATRPADTVPAASPVKPSAKGRKARNADDDDDDLGDVADILRRHGIT